jgi:hypothetical protein
MRPSSEVVGVSSQCIEHALGVLAERFGVDIATATRILRDVARAQDRTIDDLAAAVVRSCTDGSTPLPRRLYTHRTESARSDRASRGAT